ncbi:MAG: beta-N-acetylhexosaminidase [Kiloniellales bacterium]|nr:beta-N-acetylhexosaminidase [Kiloniellales bacterium]
MTPRARSGGATRRVIFGCEGTRLTDWEASFFAESRPLGFILFARNCQSPDQVRGLVASLRETIGDPLAPILMDQEGGRVLRLKPPQWPALPAARRFGELAERGDPGAERALELFARLLAAQLLDLGISVDCVPLLDLRSPTAHDVIGDRAFGDDPELVARLGRVVCDVLLASGVMPVVKHMPGHGRAKVDSHAELPLVEASREALEATDFAPFRALKDAPWGMTAHVLYQAIDPERPATTSPRVIAEVIRGWIGFDGVLVSDDLSMDALEGSVGSRARAALEAGCDLALHCNGEAAEMEAVAANVDEMTAATHRRLEAAAARLAPAAQADAAALRRQLDAHLAEV